MCAWSQNGRKIAFLGARSLFISVNYLVNHILLGAVLCDNSTQLSELMVRKKGRVIRNEQFQETGVETWEGLGVVRELQCVFRSLWKCLDDCVWPVVMSMNFTTRFLSFRL